MLETDIYVYTKVGFLYEWQRFSRSILSGYPAKNVGGLYLQNASGVHYDIVLDVVSSLTPHSNHGNKRKWNNEQSHHHKTKSVSISQPPKLAKANHEADISKHGYFTLSNREDLAHSSSDSDSELTSKNTLSSQNTDSDNEIHVKSIKKKAQHTSGMTNAGNKDKWTIDVDSAQKHLSNFHKSIQYNMYQCKICFEAWPLKGKVKSKNAYICQRYSSDKKIPKKFSASNQMIPSCIPNELQDLTQIEEMLIARALPIMNVYVKPGGQRGFSGHCINLPQQVSELAQSLPRYPKHVSLLLVTMNGKDNAFKDVIVRRSKVQQALIWLIKNNPHYSNVTLNLDSLQSLPVNGVPDDLQSVETSETEFQSIETSTNTSDDSDEDQLINNETRTSSFLPHNENEKLEKDAILSEIGTGKINWPTIEDKPLNEYTISGLATLAFPTLFPDGKGDPTNPCLHRDVPFNERIKHLLKFAETTVNGKFYFRFASHPRFSYWALNMIQRSELCNKQLFSLNKTLRKHI